MPCQPDRLVITAPRLKDLCHAYDRWHGGAGNGAKVCEFLMDRIETEAEIARREYGPPVFNGRTPPKEEES